MEWRTREEGMTKSGEPADGTDMLSAIEVALSEVPALRLGEDNSEKKDSSVSSSRNRSTQVLVKNRIIREDSEGRNYQNILCSQKVTEWDMGRPNIDRILTSIPFSYVWWTRFNFE